MKNSNAYNDTVSLLTSQEKFHIKLGLERVEALLERFGNPHDKVKCIHVAGTNGKGSTCAMIASVLAEAGYKTGLYTSPHLVEYTERIKINGQDISKNDFAKIISRVIEKTNQNSAFNYTPKNDENPGTLPADAGVTKVSTVKLSDKNNPDDITHESDFIPATEFEILTVAAFVYFYEQGVDFAVMETGLGGRLDATNVVKKPLVSVITDIGLDHTSRLGGTIEEIAFEKAGIVKPNVPVVVLKDNAGIDAVQKRACELASELILADADNAALISAGWDPHSAKKKTESKGNWQLRNTALAQEAINRLRKQEIKITETAEQQGLKNTKWRARFEYIEEENLIIDAAHNPMAATALRQSLDEKFPDTGRVFIYSSLNNKDYREVMRTLFREEDKIILTRNPSPACEKPEVLKECLNGREGVSTTENVTEAFELAKKLADRDDLIVFTGSIYTIGEFLAQRVF